MSIGRLLRAQMLDDARETPERIAERIRHRAACEQAHDEACARFGEITAENARDFLAWRESRIGELSS